MDMKEERAAKNEEGSSAAPPADLSQLVLATCIVGIIAALGTLIYLFYQRVSQRVQPASVSAIVVTTTTTSSNVVTTHRKEKKIISKKKQ